MDLTSQALADINQSNTTQLRNVFAQIYTLSGFIYHLHIEVFHLFPGPWRLSEEFQAGLNTWVLVEAFDPDVLTQAFPAIKSYKLNQDGFQGLPMQRIV